MAGPQLEGLLEQDRQQEPQELQEQQQQGGQQLAELLDPPQLEPVAPQEPGNQEEVLPVFGPPTPAWLCPGRLPRSQQSRGGRKAWWRSPA